MPEVYCFFDESGAKGHADKKERFEGESGTVAGFVVLVENMKEYCDELDALLSPYTCSGKLHITDLTPEQQSALRDSIFDWLQKHSCPCFFDAQYVSGFGEAGLVFRKFIESARDASCPRFKHGSNLPAPESLHKELFQGLAMKVFYWCKQEYGDNFHIDYLTDRVDKVVLRLFEQAINEAIESLSLQNMTRTRETTVFDTQTREKRKKSVTSHLEFPERWKIDQDRIGGVNLADPDSPFIVVADVIANSLNHHFDELQVRSKGLTLGSSKAIDGYPLCGLFKGIQESDVPQGIDAVFQYPGRPESELRQESGGKDADVS